MSDTQASPASPLDDLYYVLDGQEVVGPMKGSSVQAMAANGSLTARSSVVKAGEETWAEAGSLGFLAPYFAPPAQASAPIARRGFVGFWLRLAAYAIDVVILNIVTTILSFILGLIIGIVLTRGGKDAETIRQVASIAGALLGLLVSIAYNIVFLASAWQATPGKRVLGMHVVRTDGRRIGWLLGTGRYFAYILSSLPLGIGFFMIGWTQEKTGLHDIICKTRVVRGRPGASAAQVVDAF